MPVTMRRIFSMNLRYLCCTLPLILVSVCGTASPISAAPPIPTRPIYTKNLRFRIPFNYDQQAVANQRISKISLYVSEDQGASWRRDHSLPPEPGRFLFEAPSDGEYWFQVKLENDAAAAPAAEQMEPGLKVVVDRSAPRLTLSARQLRPGRVQVSWDIEDPHLDETQLRLEYQVENRGRWQPISIGSQSSGKTQWSLPQGGQVTVRATAADLAGNTEEAESNADIEPASAAVPEPNRPHRQEPIASLPDEAPEDLADPLPNRIAENESNNDQRFQPVAPPPEIDDDTPYTGEEFVSNSKPLESRWSNDAPKTERPQATQNDNVPLRFMNTRLFNIGYKVDEVGPSGISSVEVYLSDDNGGAWKMYGLDEDLSSPVQINVKNDGRYGFAMRVRSGVGLGVAPPKSGDKPDMIVVVDTIPPALRLMPLEQGQGAAHNQVLIQWDLQDQNLGAEPISLSYAPSADGPWTPIEPALANTGRYLWDIGEDAPLKLWIRVQAKDAAGNAQTAAGDQPILVDRSRPRARIVDVKPDSSNGLR